MKDGEISVMAAERWQAYFHDDMPGKVIIMFYGDDEDQCAVSVTLEQFVTLADYLSTLGDEMIDLNQKLGEQSDD